MEMKVHPLGYRCIALQKKTVQSKTVVGVEIGVFGSTKQLVVHKREGLWRRK